MGVFGLTTVLQQHGWMPRRSGTAGGGCTTPLWREASLERIERIAAGSTLLIDGNGLAHYLFDVAYSRYWESLVAPLQEVGLGKQQQSDDCRCPETLTSELVVQCLPQSMPLHILDQVTREFADGLSAMKLVVYWDGEDRRFKAETGKQRRGVRSDEWSNLHQFCQRGSLPFGKPCCRTQFRSAFPQSRLLLHQVRATLQSISPIQHVQCTEEADPQLALAASQSNDDNTYCVGMDSDFLLFRDTPYIPLSTLSASNTNHMVSGNVMTRDDLANLLHLPSSEAVVELGILLGNDYVKRGDKLSHSFKNAEDAIEFLQQQSGDYKVTTKSAKVQRALDFTRALYSFAPLDDFPLDPEIDRNGNTDEDASGDRPVLPVSLDLSLLAMEPVEFSLRDVIVRYLQAYIDQAPADEPPIITQLQLDTFIEVNKALGGGVLDHDRNTLYHQRLDWQDVLASYAIEKCLAHVFRTYDKTPVVQYSSPMKMFDQLSFHSRMNAKRNDMEQEQTVAAAADTARLKGNTRPHMSNTNPADANGTGANVVETLNLPIDEFKDQILHSIQNHRVTIIHGETGCGKSSRVPIMILRAAAAPHDKSNKNASGRDVKMFISQPRRIAAKSLVERVRSCEPDLKHKIALRMGHGEREYETGQTRAWFVTTGYLVRLLANHPERFNSVSHLVIDEVHERSVDSDVLCLLCKGLLETNPNIRLVLMSATLAANMYADYFGVSEPPIKVGGRRFPIQEYFIEDLIANFKLPARELKGAKAIQDHCEKTKCRAAPPNTYMENLYQLAVRTTAAVGKAGSSVLIFVAGMNDIISIIDLIEKLYIPGVRFTCFPIHSDVPFEEQMAAFDKPAPDEIKVIIGTNAAESSITLPDVDHVVCLGLQKQIVYNAASHRQLLTPAWISQANAIQRAGRTGRVRNGNVYRLYTRRAFDEYMAKFEIGEMSRVPLDSVILSLKEMLNTEATPVLLNCLEPPELRTIERSFESLHSQQFLSTPDDKGNITNLGSFVSSLGIDLMLGSLIGLGIQFGVGAEAIEMAAIFSFSKSPWIISNSLFHESPEFNDLTSRTFTSRCHFDANLYSEPLAIMNLMWDYELARDKKGFGWNFSLALARLKRLVSTRNSIRSRVARFVGCDEARFTIKQPPSRMPHAKTVLLRIIQVWVLHDNLIKSFQDAVAPDDFATVTLRKNLIKHEQLMQVLDEERHPFELVTHRETEMSGQFTLDEQVESFTSFLASFEDRFISYCSETGFNMAWYRYDPGSFVLIVADAVARSSSIKKMKRDVLAGFTESFVTARSKVDGNHRGRNGRPCGLWKIKHMDQRKDKPQPDDNLLHFVRFATDRQDNVGKLTKFLKIKSLQTDHVDKTLSCHFFLSKAGKKKRVASPTFSLFSRGQCDKLSKQDVMDLFSTSEVIVWANESGNPTQEVRFKLGPSLPLAYKNGKNIKDFSGIVEPSSSWEQPLLHDIPEGARVLSVIASSRRPEHFINFTVKDDNDSKEVKVELSRTETRIPDRWTSFIAEKKVYVETNCVPAASMSMDGPVEVFAVAGDSLELHGGSLRVLGLTALPPGRLFLLLCLKTFGLHPFSTSFGDFDEDLDQCLLWLEGAKGKISLGNLDDDDVADRIVRAIQFHEDCGNLGERLECYPELVCKLLSIFDEIDGYACPAWDGLFQTDEEIVVQPTNTQPTLKELELDPAENANDVMRNTTASELGKSCKSSGVHPGGQPAATESSNSLKKKSKAQGKRKPKKGIQTDSSPTVTQPRPDEKESREDSLVTQFSKKARANASRLFALNTDDDNVLQASDLPSTNILSILVESYRNETNAAAQGKQKEDVAGVPAQWQFFADLSETSVVAQDERVALVPTQWRVHRVMGGNGRNWYSAAFTGKMIPLRPLEGRRDVKAWMKGDIISPSTNPDALSCVPPNVASRLTYWKKKVTNEESVQETLILFPDLETALRMGAAYWLERQFYDGERHWYQVSFNEMMSLISSVQNLK